ncbi:MAG: response regulator, partial [Bacillota bacterium]
MNEKLLLVDDHLIFIEGLKYLLETYEISVTGIANNGRDAIIMSRKLKPEIILLDVKMPDVSGLEVLKVIKAEMPEIKVIMLTASEDDEDLFKALKLGASGYILKNLDGDKLVALLEGLSKGEAPLSRGLSARILKEFQRIQENDNEDIIDDLKKKEKIHRLTDRQMEIIQMISMGKTYKETAR